MEASVMQIINGLIQKTTEKKASWKDSSTKGEYKIFFEGATLTIGKFANSYGNYLVLTILNNEGKVIVKETAYTTNPASNKLNELFIAAQESSLKKNDTLQSIIEQLKQDTVGDDRSSGLPF